MRQGWAGLCPGNHESGGKRLSNRTRKGNRWLRRGLCQAAWAATRKNNCCLAAFFYRKAGKHGIRKAIVALAHRILVIAFCLLRDGTEYREAGGGDFDKLNSDRETVRNPGRQAQTAQGRPCLCTLRSIPWHSESKKSRRSERIQRDGGSIHSQRHPCGLITPILTASWEILFSKGRRLKWKRRCGVRAPRR